MANRYETNLKFADLLYDKDPILFSKLENIKQRGLDEWVPLLSFDRGSHGGYPHLLNVERNANKIVPDSIKLEFSAGEIFLLLASIFLHDIGRFATKSGQKHSEKSREIIQECWAQLGLPDEKFAFYCSVIAYFHGEKSINTKRENVREYYMASLEPYGLLRIPFLTSIVRLADEAENCWTRSLQEYLFKRIKETGIPLIKAVRRLIEDVEFSHHGECIILHLPKIKLVELAAKSEPNDLSTFYLKEEEKNTLNNMKNEIEQILDVTSWGKFLIEQNIRFNNVFYEHRNSLLSNLDFDENNEIKKERLATLLDQNKDEKRPGVKSLLDAMVRLYLGSLQYETFKWQALEAEVGYILTEREKWILERINYITPEINISFYKDDNVKINLSRKNLKQIYETLGCNIERE